MEAHASLNELRADHCLPLLRTEIWNGFIFINLDGKAAPLSPRLKKLSSELENYHLSDLIGTPVENYSGNPWNWKSMHENGLEPYHALYAHKGYHEMAPAETAVFPDWDDDDGAIYNGIKLAHIDAAFTDTTKCLFPIISTLAERDRWRFVVSVIPPNILIATLSDLAFYFLVLPHGANSMTLRVGFLFPKSTLELPDFDQTLAKVLEGFNTINDQDISANKNVQKGKRSRFGHRGRMAPLETPTDHLNRWLVKRYRAYANEVERSAGKADGI
jgi:phenylpropionate dioxygenase-like ring-hydroxylating dioxygenase large terminal subunit